MFFLKYVSVVTEKRLVSSSFSNILKSVRYFKFLTTVCLDTPVNSEIVVGFNPLRVFSWVMFEIKFSISSSVKL